MAKTVTLLELHAEQRALVQGLGPFNSGDRQAWRCGRRFGKTSLLESIAVARAVRGHKVGWFAPNYKLLLPTYKRTLSMLRPAVRSASKVDAIIELRTGGLLEFWTLNDEDAGRSRSYDLAILDEAGLVKTGLRDTFEQSIRPTLLDRNGDAIMAGTPKGISDENYFYAACTDKLLGWAERHKPTSDNPKLDRGGVARLKDENPPLVYQQEYLAEFVDFSGEAFFSLDNLLANGQPVAMPATCDAVFCTIDSATKTGREHDGTAVCYWALAKYGGNGYKLALLDYDIVQIEGGLLEVWLPQVFANLADFALTCKARNGSLGAFIEDKASGMILLQQAKRRGWQAHPIESGLTAVGKDERGISTSGYVFRGEVKLTTRAFGRLVNYKGNTKNHLIAQVCGYRVGVKDGDDDLFDAFCYGIAIALGDRDGN